MDHVAGINKTTFYPKTKKELVLIQLIVVSNKIIVDSLVDPIWRHKAIKGYILIIAKIWRY